MKKKILFLFTILVISNSSFAQCNELFFSEYIEGFGANKALEIFNPTDTAINLSDYEIQRFINGQSTPNSSMQGPNEWLQPNDVYVISGPQAFLSGITSVADTIHVVAFYDGNDAMVLKKISTNDTLDIIGQIGVNPGLGWTVSTGATNNHTLVRKAFIKQGQTNWTLGANEWDVHPQNFTDSLGDHVGYYPCFVNDTLTINTCNAYLSPSGNYTWSSGGTYTDTTLGPTTSDTIWTIYLTISLPSNTIYVDGTASGGNDGCSWYSAFTHLDTALAVASAGDTILVAQGTYYPTTGTDRSISFVLQDSVVMLGGYPSGGGVRDWENNQTILSGDIGTLNSITDNSYHVVRGDSLDSLCVLDGFFITGGKANGPYQQTNDHRSGAGIYLYYASPTLNQLNIHHNEASVSGGGMHNNFSSPNISNSRLENNTASFGGGMRNGSSTSLRIKNVYFVSNTASSEGGGIYNSISTLNLENVIFELNSSSYDGGGIYNDYSSLNLKNVIFESNSCSNNGGGIYNDNSSAQLTQVIFYDNGSITSSFGGGIYNTNISTNLIIKQSVFADNIVGASGSGEAIFDGNLFISNSIFAYDDIGNASGATISHSLVPANYGGTNNIVNFAPAPFFVSWVNPKGPDGIWMTADDGFRLKACVPMIDAGTNTSLGPNDTLDIIGDARIQGGTVDMGPYEHVNLSQPVVYVDSNATGNNDGLSWVNAFTDLQEALSSCLQYDTILVAQGTYYPTTGTDRSISFVLQDSVVMLGGYPSGGGVRDWENNQTILSGDIGTLNSITDNSYHVVRGDSLDSLCVLDGFYITGGKATGPYQQANDHTSGAGIYLFYASPTLNQLNIHHNEASVSGGGMLNNFSSPNISNSRLENNTATNGGGMRNGSSTSLRIKNVYFVSNTASSGGGGIYNSISTLNLENVIFELNSSSYDGGGIYNDNSSLSSKNVIFESNSAFNSSGGIHNDNSSAQLTQVIFYNNNSLKDGGGVFNLFNSNLTINQGIFAFNSVGATYSGTAIYNNGSLIINNSILMYNDITGSSTISHSLVPTNYGGTNNIINGSPASFFAHFSSPKGPDGIWMTADDGYRMIACSPTVDAGSNAVLGPNDTLDIKGDPRIQGGIVDMGPYEFNSITQGIAYVDSSATGNNDGSSWTNAFTDLQEALSSCLQYDTILVAQGTYYPTTGTDRSISFVLQDSVVMLGGYPSGGGVRDWENNQTILSGDIGTLNSITDNSYHVVRGDSLDSLCVLDGFYITGGKATGPYQQANDHTSGAGIYLFYASPTLNQLNIHHNEASVSGGGMYNNISSPNISNSRLENNTAISGGGMRNQHSNASMKCKNLYIANNTASSGGGMYNQGASSCLENAIFEGNSSYIGGGMYNTGASPSLNKVVFESNSVTGPSGSVGGGMYNENSTPAILNSIFYTNYADESGGGIDNVNSSPVIKQSVFINNSVGSMGSGGEAIFGGSPFISNSIFAFDDIGNASGATISHSLLLYNYGGTNNIINSAPALFFVDHINPKGPDGIWMTADDGLRMVACSPTIDAGTNTALGPNDTLDIKGDTRIQGGTVDMGPYEGGKLPTQILSTANASDTANTEITDANGWTHYCNCDANINNSRWLLSLKKNGNHIGHIDSGMQVSVSTNSLYGTNVATDLSTAPYVTADTFFAMNRYWQVTPTTQPSTPVEVRFPYSSTDFADLQGSQAQLMNHSDMAFFKVDSGYHPHSLTVPSSAYHDYANGVMPDTSTWVYTDYTSEIPNVHYAEYAVNSFSGGGGGFGNGTNNGPLPVRYVNFSVYKQGTSDVVKWTTAYETNNSHFNVQRSSNGISFETLGRVNSEAPSTSSGGQQLKYTYLDEAPAIGHNYYRLEQVDLDGRRSFSKVIDIVWTETGTVSLYPNPIKDDLNVYFSSKKVGPVELKLIDMSGRVVKSRLSTSERGMNHIIISTSELANGIYHIQLLHHEMAIFTGKIMK